jgi:ATP-dependent DNA helicase RecQ
MSTQALSVLQQYWGYPQFRPMQADIIQSVLDGRDTLALLPTGGGKSLCYQVPALCMEGMCIVVSPLIALMKDQVQHMRERGIAAAAVYSGMSRREVDIILENACQGAYKLLYLSPERLKTDILRARVERMNVNLLAVDEAHCISQWGYDFRPPYLQIAELRPLLPKVPVMALTATATPDVIEDIQEKLAFRAKNVFRQSFRRDNLSYSVLYESHKTEKLLDILKRVPGSGVIYLRSRGETQIIATFLQKHKISADFYHAGLTMEQRNARQEAWINGTTRVMVCTNAFGMGIDKPDVRTVVHLGLPDSLEAYFQEAGRAGRDGKKSYAVLLFQPDDSRQLLHYHETAFPPLEFVRRVYQALGSATQVAIGAGANESFDFNLQQFCLTYQLEQPLTHAALRLLEQEAWIAVSDAVFVPPRVFVQVDREKLYDYQLRHPQADIIIKAMLRTASGVQREFVDINEGAIAKMAKTTIDLVQKTLLAAQKEGILQYQPRSDQPKLTFTRERVTAEQLSFDTERLKYRREKSRSRIVKAIEYAETRRCRSQLLLSYFGETESTRCGVCDVCTGRNESQLDSATIQLYQQKIKEVLRDGPLPYNEILSAFAQKRHDTIAQVLQYLIGEGVVVEDEEGLMRFRG